MMDKYRNIRYRVRNEKTGFWWKTPEGRSVWPYYELANEDLYKYSENPEHYAVVKQKIVH